MLIIGSNSRANNERVGRVFPKKERNDINDRSSVVSTKLERCCIVSLRPDLHNYRAWSAETVEFKREREREKKIIPDFFTLFPNHFYPLSRPFKFVSTRYARPFPEVEEKRVAGGKIVRGEYKTAAGWIPRIAQRSGPWIFIQSAILVINNRFEERKRSCGSRVCFKVRILIFWEEEGKKMTPSFNKVIYRRAINQRGFFLSTLANFLSCDMINRFLLFTLCRSKSMNTDR